MKNIILIFDLMYVFYFMFNYPNTNIWLNILVIMINIPYLIYLCKNNSSNNQ
jgi:hypothetical protein